jgi:rhodanese-related sulfurtransferase
MWLKSYHPRQMEEYLSESVLARRFLDLKVARVQQIRDHSSIARAEAALGAAGKAAVNALVITSAQALGFAGTELLSSDTTVQEPAIGYPNEPGILKGWAERIERALKKLKPGGVQGAQAGIAQAREIYHRVKHHHLFATTKEEKQRILQQLVNKSEELAKLVDGVIKQVSERCGRVKQNAKAKLIQMGAVARTLLPQIKQWMETGKVATEKIIHAGLTQARAIPKGKGRVKFGMKWLIHRLTGGDLFGHRVAPHADENQMPAESLKDYRELFGQKATPKMVVYDRGASLPVAAAKLKQAGVRKVGIPPRGQGAWLVGEKDQKVVKSERGKTEGSLGRLKSRKYGFSHRQERSAETQDAAGQRALMAVNLNTLLQDLVEQATAASLA